MTDAWQKLAVASQGRYRTDVTRALPCQLGTGALDCPRYKVPQRRDGSPAKTSGCSVPSPSLPQTFSTVLLTLWTRFNQSSKGDGLGWDGMQDGIEWDDGMGWDEMQDRIRCRMGWQQTEVFTGHHNSWALMS